MDSILKKTIKILKSPLFILSLILVLALLLRLREINETSYWFDEAFTAVTVRSSWKDMFGIIKQDGVHPPVYYIILKIWSSIFGYSQAGIRSFSLITGLATVVVAFLLGKLYDVKYPIKGLVSAFIIAISPFFVTYSLEARSYSFVAMLAVFLTYFVIKFLTNNYKLKYLIPAFLIALLMFFTHYVQVVFIVAIIIASLFYSFVYTKKGVNKNLLYLFIGTIILSLILQAVLPVKEFVESKNIMNDVWWIPQLKLSDAIRFHYSYFFGVTRYISSVPPMREMSIPISQYLIAGVLSFIHVLCYILILLSKKFTVELKRKLTFIFTLWSICYFGYLYMSLIGLEVMVERYTIACGVILLISFFLMTTTLLGKKFFYIPIILYILIILQLKPMAESIENREMINEITKYRVNNEDLFYKDPWTFVIGSAYLGLDNTYYIHWDGEGTQNWAIQRKNPHLGKNLEDMKSGDILIITEYSEEMYPVSEYTLLSVNKYFSLLQKK